jgi:hypothetical protein
MAYVVYDDSQDDDEIEDEQSSETLETSLDASTFESNVSEEISPNSSLQPEVEEVGENVTTNDYSEQENDSDYFDDKEEQSDIDEQSELDNQDEAYAQSTFIDYENDKDETENVSYFSEQSFSFDDEGENNEPTNESNFSEQSYSFDTDSFTDIGASEQIPTESDMQHGERNDLAFSEETGWMLETDDLPNENLSEELFLQQSTLFEIDDEADFISESSFIDAGESDIINDFELETEREDSIQMLDDLDTSLLISDIDADTDTY